MHLPLPLPRLLILPALATLFALALTASPASAVFDPPPVDCPCWDDGGPFYTPAAFCHKATTTRFGFVTGTFAQTVSFGAVSYCRNNGRFAWTTPDEHVACNVALHLACSPLLAVAYIDRNDNDVFDRPDGLIAKLVDTNGNGAANPGDAMVTDEYPATLGSTSMGGEFTVKATPCDPTQTTSESRSCRAPDGVLYEWRRNSEWSWFISLGSSLSNDIFIRDARPPFMDEILIEQPGPLMATTPIDTGQESRPADENHIDVDLF